MKNTCVFCKTETNETNFCRDCIFNLLYVMKNGMNHGEMLRGKRFDGREFEADDLAELITYCTEEDLTEAVTDGREAA